MAYNLFSENIVLNKPVYVSSLSLEGGGAANGNDGNIHTCVVTTGATPAKSHPAFAPSG